MKYSLYVLLILIPAIFCTNCPDGWVYQATTSQCYYYSDLVVNSNDQAATFCSNYSGGSLVSILSPDDYNFVTNIIETSGGSPYLIWIGLESNNLGALSWIDGSKVNYTKFSDNSTADLIQSNCFALRTKSPNDGFVPLSCGLNQPFLCKQHSSSCGLNLFTNSSGTILSPNYPSNYDNGLSCEYKIVLPDSSKLVRLSMTFLDIEQKWDYLRVYDGTKETGVIIANYTGDQEYSTLPSYLIGSSNVLTLYFYTDKTFTAKGFQAKYSSVSQLYYIKQNGTSGEISSTNYPQNYDPWESQYYIITAPPGTVVKMEFVYFETSRYDTELEIYDGKSTSYKRITSLSGSLVTDSSKPLIFRSTQNVVTLFFTAYDLYPLRGFDMIWSAEYQ
uniref:C-type LECtin n=1 Tax=Rhabditophanes sp. KR3021 TaxID=114890 RepID=A0AC35TWU6_9BILA